MDTMNGEETKCRMVPRGNENPVSGLRSECLDIIDPGRPGDRSGHYEG